MGLLARGDCQNQRRLQSQARRDVELCETALLVSAQASVGVVFDAGRDSSWLSTPVASRRVQ
jgi:hypothetical protein